MLPATIEGEVKQFNGKGRQLGYPTANLMTDTDLDDGVYFGHADLIGYKNQPALIFVGVPTTMGDTERRVEVHLLDIPDEDYYEENLTATLEYYHRPNETFANAEELLVVMKDDEAKARVWVSSGSTQI